VSTRGRVVVARTITRSDAERLFDAAVARDTPLFMFDSAVGHPDLGQRSYVALEVEPVVEAFASRTVLRASDGTSSVVGAGPDVWRVADRVFAQDARRRADSPLGWVGYVTYEAAALADAAMPAPPEGSDGAPLMAFFRVCVAACAVEGRVDLVAEGVSADDAHAKINAWMRAIEHVPVSAPVDAASLIALKFLGRPSQAWHAAQTARVLDAIATGRVYQACLTFPLWFARPATLAPYFRALRAQSPGDFAAYIRCGDVEAASCSPERFLEVSGGYVVARPMKGTRRRDAAAPPEVGEACLFASAKDRAENVMIVDLLRNDLGRVCEVGSVHVPELYAVETYRTVHQMTSTVRGKLRADVGPFALLKATFPPGSMTGAPKVEACRLIRELEDESRGLYAGTIAWLGYHQPWSMGVVIRTLQAEGERVRWDVGGGIVADSTAAEEWREAQTKARVLDLLSDVEIWA